MLFLNFIKRSNVLGNDSVTSFIVILFLFLFCMATTVVIKDHTCSSVVVHLLNQNKRNGYVSVALV